MDGYRYHIDDDGIATVVLDTPDRSVNLMDAQFIPMMDHLLQRLDAEGALKGVILTSAKSTFVAGGDIAMLAELSSAREAFDMAEALKARLRRLETLGKPVLAALNGSALGGGMELALACHGRIALRGSKTQFGFPEVTLGLLPGAGGIVRLVRMVGLKGAWPYLMQGTRIDADEALNEGWIDAVVDTEDALIEAARKFLEAHAKPAKPWDEKREKIPGGQPYIGALNNVVLATFAQTFKACGREPAPHAILAAATEGAACSFAAACKVESRYFAQLAVSPEAKSKLGAFKAA